MRRHIRRHSDRARELAMRHRQRLIQGGLVLLGLILLFQLFYPGDRMPLFAAVDGIGVSGKTKRDAIVELDKRAEASSVEVSLGGASQRSIGRAKPEQIGITVSNHDRIEQATYPWYIRIIPTSLLWFGLLQTEKPPAYKTDTAAATSYVERTIGTACTVSARDATLKLKDSTLTVVSSESGGSCEQTQAVKALLAARPRPDRIEKVVIPVDVIAPKVGDDAAKKLAEKLNTSTKSGVPIRVADKRVVAEQKEVLSWLDFEPNDESLGYSINHDRANAYFSKHLTPTIAKPAGVTKVSTLDFAETSRLDGATGQTLSVDETISDVQAVIDGKKSSANAVVQSLPPTVQYTRSYTKSSTGIAAQIKFYDEDDKGVFGVSFTELGGQGLSAQHNASQQFVTASTYKLFVAFSTLKRVDAGQMKWDDADISSGRNLSTCFDDMIVKSDNACAEALIKKIGAKELNADINSIGLSGTAFRSDNNLTTAADLANYLTQLQTSKLPIKPESRDRLLGAMKRNVYRQGVPAGASGQTADKVGFLWGLLHDAAIVYSPKGTYVLTVMSDGSSWAAIADLTRKIEALR